VSLQLFFENNKIKSLSFLLLRKLNLFYFLLKISSFFYNKEIKSPFFFTKNLFFYNEEIKSLFLYQSLAGSVVIDVEFSREDHSSREGTATTSEPN
jgi:hypothetical protein